MATSTCILALQASHRMPACLRCSAQRPMNLRLATKIENAPGNSPPDSGGVARRAPGWLFLGAQNTKAQSAPPPTPSSTEGGSCFHPHYPLPHSLGFIGLRGVYLPPAWNPESRGQSHPKANLLKWQPTMLSRTRCDLGRWLKVMRR